MATDFQSPPQGASRPGTKAHESRDARVGWVFGAVLLLFLGLLGIHFVLAGWLGGLKKSAPPTDTWGRPGAPAPSGQVKPSFPRLQVSPPADLEAFRAREAAQLNDYGWVNKTAGVVRLPIERAMELVLQRGLPARSKTNENQLGPSAYQLIQGRAPSRAGEGQGEK